MFGAAFGNFDADASRESVRRMIWDAVVGDKATRQSK